MDAREWIKNGKAVFGMEFGSTRIKAVLTDTAGTVLAVGSYDWENSLIDGIWTYSLEEIHAGLRGCYASLRRNVEEKYGVTPESYAAMGFSAMMHGYLPFDAEGRQLSRFQTWRNTNTQEAADALTDLFSFNIPLRWSIAHVYQCMLDKEEHVAQYDYITTLAGYVHWILTGERVIGIGDASGMFPIDPETKDYNETMVQAFDALAEKGGYTWKLRDIFPKVLLAGEPAGVLTEKGAAFLDESGSLHPGIPLCPPEGDGDTGVVATNTITKRTGSVSAGTSTFAMVVLEKELSRVYREIDVMMTPDGSVLAQSHGNNGTTDLNAWVGLFQEFAALTGGDSEPGHIFETLYRNSLKGDEDCGGMLSYCFLAGESLTGINEGRPLFVRKPGSAMNLANFMKAHIYGSLAIVKMGLDILKNDGVEIDRILGQGGFFKTREVGQRALAAAVGTPVTVMETASEGGAWAIALLASYMAERAAGCDLSLAEYLDQKIFAGMTGVTVTPTKEEIDGFDRFMKQYKQGLEVEKAAVNAIV